MTLIWDGCTNPIKYYTSIYQSQSVQLVLLFPLSLKEKLKIQGI